MALGVLLILSASFLAVQLWSEKVYRGAAQALEAPVMPPAMPTARKVRSGAALDKKIEKAKTVAAVEVVNAPEVQSNEEVARPEPVTTPEKSRPVALQPAKMPGMIEAPALPPSAGTRGKPVKGASKSAAGEAAVRQPKPVVESASESGSEVKEQVSDSIESAVEPKQTVQPVAAKPAVKAAEAKAVEPVVKAEPVVATPAVKAVETMATLSESEPRKTLAKRRKAAKPVDESEIPQEWNWFDTPLKIEVSDGHVEIVPSVTVSGVQSLSEAPKIKESVAFNPSAGTSEENIRVDLASEKPFVAALARMGRLRSNRSAVIAENPELEKAVAARRSESIARLQEAVASLCQKLEATEPIHVGLNLEPDKASPVAIEDAFAADESAPVVESADESQESSPVVAENTVSTAEPKFVPYYSGSGSELSSRINDLILKGVGSKRR